MEIHTFWVEIPFCAYDEILSILTSAFASGFFGGLAQSAWKSSNFGLSPPVRTGQFLYCSDAQGTAVNFLCTYRGRRFSEVAILQF